MVKKEKKKCWLWWHTPVFPPGRGRQEDHEFKASLGYIAAPNLKKNKIEG
jgi:hypothetical protein